MLALLLGNACGIWGLKINLWLWKQVGKSLSVNFTELLRRFCSVVSAARRFNWWLINYNTYPNQIICFSLPCIFSLAVAQILTLFIRKRYVLRNKMMSSFLGFKGPTHKIFSHHFLHLMWWQIFYTLASQSAFAHMAFSGVGYVCVYLMCWHRYYLPALPWH